MSAPDPFSPSPLWSRDRQLSGEDRPFRRAGRDLSRLSCVLAGPTVGAGVHGIAGFVRGKDFDLQGAIVRAGLNLKFGPGGPITAAY